MFTPAIISESPVSTPWGNIGTSSIISKTVKTHEPLFCEGDEATHVYEILEGVVCCYKIFSDGRRQVITFAFPGDLVGFGHGKGYRFDCDAVGTARVNAIPTSSLLRAVKERPDLGEKLLEMATSEVASMQNHSLVLGRKSALEKIAYFLVELCERSADCSADSIELKLPMTRADIADFLGLTVETVSRSLTKLRVKNLIELPHPATLFVRDIEALRDLAECEETFH